MKPDSEEFEARLDFYGGYAGVLLPFVVFLTGAIIISLSGAPDERGLWPVLIVALGLGLLLAKDRKAYSEIAISGMSQKIIMIMITAWMLASCIGVLMTKTGLVQGLIWLSVQMSLGPAGFVLATFLICCIVSLSTGSSFATILICSPLLYPAGGLMGVDLPILAGAILAGATFGDFTAPISDTTIASTISQEAELGATVKSRLKFTIPIVAIAGVIFVVMQLLSSNPHITNGELATGDPKGLPMLLVPVLVIFLFLRKKHLLHGLMAGLFFGIAVGLLAGLLPISELMSLDLENFRATSFIIDGIDRAVGISFFTILLMGMVQTVKASGIFAKIIQFAEDRTRSMRASEGWITMLTSLAVLLTTHSIVAILMVKEFVSITGKRTGVSSVRRSNIMSMVACFFPFVLPYFIPVILMSNMTQSGKEFGIPQLTPLDVGFYNLVAWGLFLWLIISILMRKGIQNNNVT